MKKQNKGFTLVELLIVIVIIGILAAIIVPSVSGAIEKANLANDQSDVKNMNTIIALEAIERNADYLEALEVQNILFEQGYDLVPQAKGYVFLYDTSENRIFLEKEEKLMNAIKTNTTLATTKAINGVYAAEEGNKDENVLEAVIQADPSIFYIDNNENRALTKVINGIRNLDANLPESGATLVDGTNEIKAAFGRAMGHVEGDIANLASHFNTMNPETTLYITDKGFFGGNVTDSKMTVDITRVYIPANVKEIPSNTGTINAILVSGVVVEIPRSVEKVADHIFEAFKDSEGIVVVVTTDVLVGHDLPTNVSLKKSSNVSTMKILEVNYTWVLDAEGKTDSKSVEFGKKNYLPHSWDNEKNKAVGAGKFEVVMTDAIKQLITDKSTIEIVNIFDKATGFTYLKAYIRNADGTLAAGIVARYMFVDPASLEK